MNINTINLKALASLARELNMHVGLLELKLQACNIKVISNEPCGFRSSNRRDRRHVLSLYN